jgi:hypothetical protein
MYRQEPTLNLLHYLHHALQGVLEVNLFLIHAHVQNVMVSGDVLNRQEAKRISVAQKGENLLPIVCKSSPHGVLNVFVEEVQEMRKGRNGIAFVNTTKIILLLT